MVTITKEIELNAFLPSNLMELNVPKNNNNLISLSINNVSNECIKMNITYETASELYKMDMKRLCYIMPDTDGCFTNTYVSIERDFRYAEIFFGEPFTDASWSDTVRSVLSLILLAMGVLVAWGTLDVNKRFVVGLSKKDTVIAFTDPNVFSSTAISFVKKDKTLLPMKDIHPQKVAKYLVEDVYAVDNKYIINTAFLHANQTSIINNLHILSKNCIVLDEI